MRTRTCTKCGQAKPLTAFHRNCNSHDGRLQRCRQCVSEAGREAYRTDPAVRAKAVWAALLRRVQNRDGKNPSYAHVCLRMTKAEFLTWAVPAYTEFLRQNPDTTPSIDRIDARGHYAIGNLRLLARNENARRAARNKNIHAPAGHAWCCRCKRYRPRDRFHKNRAQPHGLDNRCRTCAANEQKAKRRQVMSPSPLPCVPLL